MMTTAKTVTVRGREYSVTTFGHTAADGSVETRYRLTGKRGAEYDLARNVRNPHMLFAMSWSSTLDGVWLSDEGGELRVVKQ